MAVTHESTVRSGIADYVVDLLDSGSTFGYVEFQTGSTTAVSMNKFGATAFGAASSGVATANAITDSSGAAGGTPTQASFYTSTGNSRIMLCSVTSVGGGGDITISSSTITAGQTVSITSLSYTAPT